MSIRKFTPAQMKKQKCFRCGAQAEYQWSACADNNEWRPLCPQCDFDLNALVIKFMGFKNGPTMLRRYARLIGVKGESK